MRRLNSTVFLALLSLLAPATATTPLGQFGNILNSTSGQLGQLANGGYNSQSFAQLSALLANLFGSMMALSEPYFNSFISQALAQNAATLEQIIQLENTSNAAATVVFNLLNSASATLGSNVAAIGSSLFSYQNTANARIYGLNNSLTSNNTLVNQLSNSLSTLPSQLDATNAVLNSAITVFNEAYRIYNENYAPYPYLLIIESPGLGLNSTADPKCAEYLIDYGEPVRDDYYGAVQVYPLRAGTETSAGPFYDVSVLSSDLSTATIEICTRDGSAILPLPHSVVLQANRY